MRVPGLSVVAVVAGSLACGSASHPSGSSGPSGALSSKWVAPPILAHVPAETPYLFASLEPVSEGIRERLARPIEQQLAKLMRTADGLRDRDRATLEPFERAQLALADELRGKDATRWWGDLGFTPGGRFVLYGLSMWPVIRIEIANPVRLRSVIERVLAAADLHPKRAELDGHAYWLAGGAGAALIAAVLDREIVVALVPTPAVDAALPLVLGTRAPAHSLGGAATVSDLLSKYRLLGSVVGYVDAHRAVELLTTQQPSAIDAPLHAWSGPISPECHADLDRLAAVVPRAVFGYHRLDVTGFDGIAIVETSPGVAAALRKLAARMPEVVAAPAGHPLFAFGAAVDPDGLIAWLRDVTRELHDHPLACPWLAGVNAAGQKLAQQLAAPLPPMFHGLHGFSLVVDDAVIKPVSVVGHLLVAGDHLTDIVAALAGKLTTMAGIQLVPDGHPIEIPTQRLGIPISSAHVALTADRLVIATGEGSARRATDHLATPVPARSPLFVFVFDGPRLKRLLASLGQGDSDFGALGMATTTFDVMNEGVGFAVVGTWDPAVFPPAAARDHR